MEFESLVPVSLAAFYSSMTTVHSRPNEKTTLIRERANAVKKLLITLAVDGDVAAVDFYTHFSSLLSAMEKASPDAVQIETALGHGNINDKGKKHIDPEIQSADHNQQQNDTSAFMQNVTLLPKNINELASKIAAYYYLTLGLDDNDIKYLIFEYMNYNGINNVTLNSVDFINKLLYTFIDQNRYPLKHIILNEDVTKLFIKLCDELKNNQLPKQIELPIAVKSSTATSFVNQMSKEKRVSGTNAAKDNVSIYKTVVDLSQINISAPFIQEISYIISFASYDKYAKHFAILDYLRSISSLTAIHLEEIFEHLHKNYLAVLNHHRNENWDSFFGKTNTTSFSTFVTNVQKLWLTKLVTDIELLPPYAKLFKLNLAKN